MKITVGIRKQTLRARVVAGAATGLVAALCAAFILMLNSAATGQGFWFPMQLVSGVFYGVDAILGGALPAILGMLIFLLSSAVAGAIFALLLPEIIVSEDLFMAGLVFGTVVWALRSYLILPIVNNTMSDRISMMSGWWFVSHLVYGAVLSYTPKLMQKNYQSTQPKHAESDWEQAA